MSLRDDNNIFPKIKECIIDYISASEIECYAFGSRTRDKGNKNDFDVIVHIPGLLEYIRETFKNEIDEFGNPVKVDLFLNISKPINNKLIN